MYLFYNLPSYANMTDFCMVFLFFRYFFGVGNFLLKNYKLNKKVCL